jgi:hypothetical protein
MTTTLHKVAPTADIHAITGLSYANASARLTAGATLDSTNIDRVAHQTDNDTYWVFLGAGVWRLLGTNRPIITDSTTARTFGMSDAEAYFRFTNGASITGTIPPNSSVAFPIGTVLECCQAGAGQFLFAAGAGVTLGPGTNFGTAGVGKVIRARKVATDTWDISGDTAAGGFAGNFASLFSSVSVLQYLRSDLGLSVTGSVVNSWADQSGNARNVSEGTAGVGIGGVTTGLSSHAGIGSNGSTQFGKYTQFEPANPYCILWVGRLLATPSSPGQLFGDNGGAAGNVTFATGGSNNLYINNGGTLGPLLQTTSQWIRGIARFVNDGNDYLKAGSSTSSTGSAGNAAGSGPRGIFARGGGGAPLSYELLLRLVLSGEPNSSEKTAFDSAVTSFYGASVQV